MIEHNDFDQLLDRTLASLGEPDLHLEERVLKNVHSQRRQTIAYWYIGSAIVASLVLVALLLSPSFLMHQRPTGKPLSSNRIASGFSVTGILKKSHNSTASLGTVAPANVSVHLELHRRMNMLIPVARRHRFPFVPEDAQEQALQKALKNPAFLASLEAAQLHPQAWKQDGPVKIKQNLDGKEMN